jgi:hypothetical protein
MHGVSWGAYWATKMAIVEHARLRGASAQSPPIDKFFQKDFLMNDLIGNREYLFDQVPALMAIFDNVHTVDEMAEVLPKMSLVKQGLLGKPMSPMLILAGVNTHRSRSPTSICCSTKVTCRRPHGSIRRAVISGGKLVCGPIRASSKK